MIIGDAILERMNKLGVEFKPKDSCWYLRWIGSIFAFFGSTDFRDSTWVAFKKAVYYPRNVIDPTDVIYASLVAHELTHIERQQSCFAWWLFKYLFLPVPILFAYYRWLEERLATIAEIDLLLEIEFLSKRTLPRYVNSTVDNLRSMYFWPWPKSWMREWFYDHFDLDR